MKMNEKINFTDRHRPAKTEDIRDFEQQSQVHLPKDYIEFLMSANGGVPTSNLVYPIEGMPNNPYGSLQLLFGLRVGRRHFELTDDNALYKGGIPRGLVLIGTNGSGDYICLDLRESHGKVAFWDKRHFWGTGEWRESDLYPVAASFGGFLESLRVAD